MTLTVTATVYTGLAQPSILVQVTSSVTEWRPVTIVRIHPDGTQYPVIRAVANRNLVAGIWFDTDRHAPFGVPVTYRATTSNQTGTSSAVTLTSSRSWIMHPSDPDLSVRLSAVRPMSSREWPDRVQRLDILNSSTPIHQISPVSLETGTLTAQVASPSEFKAIQKLVGGPVLLNLALSDYDVGWLWAVIRAPQLVNAAPSAAFKLRDFVLKYEGSRQPDVDGVGFWTVADLAATGWTITQANAKYSSVTNMALDVRLS